MPVLKVAVIGAGAAGLCSAKRAAEEGFKVTVYEQSEHLGGQWCYIDQTGKDQYGVNIHTAMYRGLRFDGIEFRFNSICKWSKHPISLLEPTFPIK